MCSILLPKGVLDILDSKRRAFLWTGTRAALAALVLVVRPLGTWFASQKKKVGLVFLTFLSKTSAS